MKLVFPTFLGRQGNIWVEDFSSIPKYLTPLMYGTVEYEFDNGCLLDKNGFYVAKSVAIKNLFGEKLKSTSGTPIEGKQKVDSKRGIVVLRTNNVILKYKNHISDKLDISRDILLAAEQAVKEKSKRLECDIEFSPDNILGYARKRGREGVYWLFFDVPYNKGPILHERNVPAFIKLVDGKLSDYWFVVNSVSNMDEPLAKIGDSETYCSTFIAGDYEFVTDGDESDKSIMSMVLLIENCFAPTVDKGKVRIFKSGSGGVCAEAWMDFQNTEYQRLLFKAECKGWKIWGRARLDKNDSLFDTFAEFYRHYETGNRLVVLHAPKESLLIKKGNTVKYVSEWPWRRRIPEPIGASTVMSILENKHVGKIVTRKDKGFNIEESSGSVDVYLEGWKASDIKTARDCRRAVKNLIKNTGKDLNVSNSFEEELVLKTVNTQMPFKIVDKDGNLVKLSWISKEYSWALDNKRMKTLTFEEYSKILETLKIMATLKA